MPRYYCDYCDTYLTHDSPSVRKQHNAGYKHKANVRAYYQQFEEQQTQSLIDQRVKEHLGQQVGAAFQQYVAMQGGQRPRLPVLAPPTLQAPGASPVSPMRPPYLPRPPMAGASGYVMPVGTTSAITPPGAAVTAPPSATQPNAFPRPPTFVPPVSTAPATVSSSLATSSSPSGASASAAYGTYSYSAPPTSYPLSTSVQHAT